MTRRLTDRLVRAAKPPKIGQRLVRDGELKGYALRITSNGCKAFVWDGRINGMMRRITLGKFPDLNADDARACALEIRHRLALGLNPYEERRNRKLEPTIQELGRIYLERHAKHHKRSWEQDAARIRLTFKPLATFRPSELTTESIERWHHRIAQKRGPYSANRSLALLSTILNLSQHWNFYRGFNPARGVRRFREEKRVRFLNAQELVRLNLALQQEPEIWRAFFLLSLFVGTRKSELLRLKWKDVDLVGKTISIRHTKADRPHILPLPEAATELLKSLRISASSDWVFPSVKLRDRHLSRPDDAWERVRIRAGLPDVRIHDLRRTNGSWLAAQGCSLPLIGRVLNHSQPSTTAIYARLDLAPIREALERNAELMLGTKRGESNATQH